MNRASDCAVILDFLSRHQHLHPHTRIEQALAHAVSAVQCCPRAAEQALQWLQLDPSASIGRLRRSQLVQLAESMHRFWRRSLEKQNVTQSPS